jgi:hypothetical protein
MTLAEIFHGVEDAFMSDRAVPAPDDKTPVRFREDALAANDAVVKVLDDVWKQNFGVNFYTLK